MVRNSLSVNSVRKLILSIALLIGIGSSVFAQYPNWYSTANLPFDVQQQSRKPASAWARFKYKIREIANKVSEFVDDNKSFLQGVATTVGIVASYKLTRVLWGQLFPSFKETIRLGNSVVKANILNKNGSVVRQIECAQQNARTCGYNSLYNTAVVLRSIFEQNTNAAEQLSAPRTNAKIQEWGQYIQEWLRRLKEQGRVPDEDEDLNEEQMRVLLNRERRAGGIFHDLPVDGYYFEIVEGIDHIRLLLEEDAENIAAAQVAAFIINTGANAGEKNGSVVLTENNHWFALVIIRDAHPQRSYTIVDSKHIFNHLADGSTGMRAVNALEQFYINSPWCQSAA